MPRSDLPKGVLLRKPLGVSRKCPKQGLQVIEQESARRAFGALFSCLSFPFLRRCLQVVTVLSGIPYSRATTRGRSPTSSEAIARAFASGE